MSLPLSGLKFAVLFGQSGFATVAAAATVGNARSGANANAAVRVCCRLSCMALTPSSSLALGRGYVCKKTASLIVSSKRVKARLGVARMPTYIDAPHQSLFHVILTRK